MTKALVVLNQQHQLLPEQVQILADQFASLEFVSVPAEGWTRSEIEAKAKELAEASGFDNGSWFVPVVFASPVPLLVGLVSAFRKGQSVFIFHNDRREKKELPNGKVISVVAQTGWELVELEVASVNLP